MKPKAARIRGSLEKQLPVVLLIGSVIASIDEPPSAATRGRTQHERQPVALAQALDAKKLRLVNREATRIGFGLWDWNWRSEDRNEVRLSAAPGNGVAWIEGTDFQSGTIEVEIRGRDYMGQRFVGVAFHRKDDNTYEAVYLRPFNFRSSDPARRQHAVQYVTLPGLDYDVLRKDFPEEFENPVDSSIEPRGWVKLRVVVQGGKVQIYVGPAKDVTLEVRKLGQLFGGQVGLWVGNDSGGDFANLVVTPGR